MPRPFAREVRAFILNNFFLGKGSDLADESSFLELGIIDSTGMLELVSYLENTYGIEISDDELTPDNLDSINRIVGYLSRKVQNQTMEPTAFGQKVFSAD